MKRRRWWWDKGPRSKPKKWQRFHLEPLESRRMLATIELVRDIFPGGQSSNPSSLTEVSGTLYFTADGGGGLGTELWRSDGSANGTQMVFDIRTNGSSFPQLLTNVNGTLFFTADDGQGRELFVTPGPQGLVNKIDIRTAVAGGSYPQNLTNVNGILYFTADDGVNGRELFRYQPGSQLNSFQLVRNIAPGAASSTPSYLTNVNGILYFSADDGVNGRELWRSDGTSNGTTMVIDLNPGSANSDPNNLASVGGFLYFGADAPGTGREPYVSDGTSAGTSLIANINGGGPSNPRFFTNYNGIAVFGANLAGSSDTSVDVYFHNPSTNAFGTVYFPPTQSPLPLEFTVANNLIFFTAHDTPPDQDRRLFVWNGSGFATSFDLNNGNNDNARDLANAANTLYFQVTTPTQGSELWFSDGSSGGTRIVEDLVVGTGSSDPRGMTFVNGYVYFSANRSGTEGRELFRVLAEPPNRAPVINNQGIAFLTPIAEDNVNNPGTPISTIINSVLPIDMISDPDSPSPEGIALIAIDQSVGTWQFSLNSGSTWTTIASVSSSNALLLASDGGQTRLRLQPRQDFFGTVTDAITFRAWDQYRGTNGSFMSTLENGGFTSFSTGTETANITVTPVPDTPVVSNAVTAEDTLSAPIVIQPNPIDGIEVQWFRISGITGGTLFLSNGTTQVTNNQFISLANALAGVRFLPALDQWGPSQGSFAVEASTSNSAAGIGGGIAFSSISVTPVAETPIVTNGTTNEDTMSGLLPISVRSPPDGTEVTHFQIINIGNGTVYLSDGISVVPAGSYIDLTQAATGVRFLPSPNSVVPGTFQVRGATSTAGTGLSTVPASVTVNVVAVNDPPVNVMPVSPQIGLQGAIFNFTGTRTMSVTDVDAGTGTMTVVLSVAGPPTPGVLRVNLSNVTASGNGTTSITMQGTLSNLNATLASLRYEPPSQTFSNTVTITMNTSDQGNTGIGPVGTDVDSINLILLPQNIAPQINPPGPQTVNEDTPLLFSTNIGNAITIFDADAGNMPLQMVILSTNGVATILNTGGLPNSGNGTAALVITGNYTQLNAALNTLQFTPTPDFPGTQATGVASMLISVDDLGNFGFGGPLTAATPISITVNAVNDAPTHILPGLQETSEGQPITFSAALGNRITVADVDVANGQMTMTLSTTPDGNISIFNGAGAQIFSNGTNLVTVTGTLAQLNGALSLMTYAPIPNINGPRTITVSTNDQGNSGLGGPRTTTDEVQLFIRNLNRPPVIAPIQFPGTSNENEYIGNEDDSVVFAGASRIIISDIDSANDPISVTLTATNGTVSIPGGNNAPGLTVTGSGTSVMTLVGSTANLQTNMNNLVFQPTADFTGAAQLTIFADDLGFNGEGGPQQTTRTVVFSFAAVNDPPINIVPPAQSTGVNSPISFTAEENALIQILDVDAANTPMRLDLEALNGTVFVPVTTGLVVPSGNLGSIVTLIGSQNAINNALLQVDFIPSPGFVGVAGLTVTTNDQNNGASGVGGPGIATSVIEIRVRNTFSEEGNSIVVSGTGQPDTMSVVFSTNTNYRITINGVSNDYSTVNFPNIVFFGGQGIDRLTVVGTAGNDVATLGPRSMRVVGSGYTIDAFATENSTIHGGSNDLAYFLDSPTTNDFLSSLPGYTVFTGPRFSNAVVGFGTVYAYSTGGNDVAQLFDSPGDDVFYALPSYAVMQGPGNSFLNQAIGFKSYYGFGNAGGFDQALLFDSDGNDTFFGLEGYGVFAGSNFYSQATAFDRVYAFGYGGGYDTAVLFDSAGNDQFIGLSTFSILYGTNFFNQATGFDVVGAIASSGYDSAALYDTLQDDTFIAQGAQATLLGNNGSYLNNVNNFDYVIALASKGNDIAYLFDTPGNDSFLGFDGNVIMQGFGYANQALGFPIVSIRGGNGGADTGTLFDSSANDMLIASHRHVEMQYFFYRTTVDDFSRVTAYSTNGGNDQKIVTALDFVLETFGDWPQTLV